MQFIEVRIAEVAEEPAAGDCHRVVLEDLDGAFRIPIVVSSYDARPLIRILEGQQVVRPRTHDLMLNFAGMAGYLVRRVEITDVDRGIFTAAIVFGNGSADPLRLDARPCDALVLALKSDCGIFVSEDLSRRAGEPVCDNDDVDAELIYSGTVDDMEKRLGELIDKEMYEEAAKLRDLINSIKGGSNEVVS